MATGTVSTVDPDSGNCTIAPDTGAAPIGFVQDPARRPLQEGDRVSYSVQLTPAGVIARGVHQR